MTQEEILEYNKRCAEFLGGKLQIMNAPLSPQWFNLPSLKEGIPEGLLRFHLDWNWIMKVVDAIEDLSKDGETYMFSITKFSIRVSYKGSRIVNLPIDTTKKEAVVQAINQFLIWYEQNKNKQL